jgi:fibronectin type 3 domain-containing protein
MSQMQVALARENRTERSASERYWRVFSMWIAGLAITLLAACGGGGGGGSSPNTGTEPPPPGGMTVSAGDGQTTISWAAVDGATSYNVYRSTTAGQQGTKVGATTTTSYVDSTALNGTTYYYQVTADNAAGEGAPTAQSPGVTPTPPVVAPPAPAGLQASAGDAQVSLTWTAVDGATSYNVYRSTSAGSQGTKVGASATTQYVDDTVVNGSTYFYVVTADNAAGEGAASAQTPAVTPVPAATVPPAPTNVAAVAGDSQVTVTWTAAAEATSYSVYRSTSAGSLGTKVGASSTTTYTDSTAANGVTYFYAVTAINAVGEGTASGQTSGVTPSVPVVAPGAPSGVNALAGDALVTLSWTAVPTATSYDVYRSTVQGTQGAFLATTSTASYSDTAVVNGTTYYYVVKAANSAGPGPASVQSGPATPQAPLARPPAPTGVNAVAGDARVTVTWAAAARAASYNIYRSTTKGVQGTKVSSTGSLTYTDLAVVNGTTYYYVVTAVNAAGESPASTQSAGATPTVPLAAPPAPGGVNVTAGNAQVAVTWSAAARATSYNVYRSTTQGVQGTKITSTGSLTYTDLAVVNGTTYYYVVTAVNAAGESPASAQSAGATPAVPVTVPAAPGSVNATAGNAQVTVTWAAAARATSYKVYRSTTQGTQGSGIGSTGTLSFTDTTAANGTTYYYVVTASNSAGEGPASTQSAGATPTAPITLPAAPTGVSAARGIIEVAVNWTTVSGATSYNVYRSTASGTLGSKIGTSATAGYADRTAVNGTVYYYAVSSVNSAGEGAVSAQAATAAANGWANAKFGGGGYVPGLIYHPTVANVLYARTDVAGAYRWDAANSKWIPITDMFGFGEGKYQGVETIALDPTDANKVYLVGGMYVNGGNARLYRSTNRGDSWNYVDLPFPSGGNNAGRAIGERLMVDPNMPSVLFYATRTQGLWKSTDSGSTWSQVTGLSAYKMTGGDIASVGNSPIGIEGVVFGTAVPPTGFVSTGVATQTIYVTVAPDYKRMAGLSSYLYKSTDGGTSWTGVAIPSLVTTYTDSAQPTPIEPHIPHFVRDMGPTGSGNFYFVFTKDTGPGAGGPAWLYRFDGTNWSAPLQTGPWTQAGLGGLSVYGYGPTTKIALGVTNTWVGSSPGVYFSQDAGASWTTIGDATNTSVGWTDDVEINPFNPDNVLHVYGGGVWSTSTASSSTPTWTLLVDGIEELATRTLMAPPAGASYLFLAGYWDVGTQVHTNLATKPTTNPGNLTFGNGNGVDMAWSNPAYIAAIGNTNGNSNTSTVGVYSTNSGTSWAAFATRPPFAPAGDHINDGGGSEANIAVMAQGKLVWAPTTNSGNTTSNGVPYYTTDNGATWTATNLPPPVQTSIGSAYHLAADRKNPNKVYAYDSGGARWSNTNGSFYYSTDGGKTFTRSTDPTLNELNFQNFWSTWLAVNPNVEGDVWLTNGDNVFHSTNSGVSWTKLTTMASTPAGYNHYNGPTFYGAQRIALGKPVPGSSYSAAVYLVGTVGGVPAIHRSDDAGATWIRINDDAHQWGGIGALAADNNVAGRVYLAARGVLYNY